MPFRYAAAAASATARTSLGAYAFSWAAMTTLVTSRFRSHSHGAIAASSKSLRSNTSVRSGEA